MADFCDQLGQFFIEEVIDNSVAYQRILQCALLLIQQPITNHHLL